MTTRTLQHNKVELALHTLRPSAAGAGGGEGRALLLLHGLGECTPAVVPDHIAAWPGAVHGLDFTGHGASTVPHGGGYTAEILMADASCAIDALGPCTVVGRGLGAYVALLVAGVRTDAVRGVVLCDGPGLAGGGPFPGTPTVLDPASFRPSADGAAPDAFALVELARDVRPPDYAVNYVRQAVQLSGLDTPLFVAAVVRPPWLTAVVEEPGVEVASLPVALAACARY